MTSNDTHDASLTPSTTEPTPHQALPFAYEDLSDGRHRRAILEIQAAKAWVQQRRALGMAPN